MEYDGLYLISKFKGSTVVGFDSELPQFGQYTASSATSLPHLGHNIIADHMSVSTRFDNKCAASRDENRLESVTITLDHLKPQKKRRLLKLADSKLKERTNGRR